jgi:hypothetical protein
MRISSMYQCSRSLIVRLLREGIVLYVFCLVVVWTVYFVGLINRDVLLCANGIFVALIIIAALLKRRMHAQLNRRESRQVRRRFPRGAMIRSGSNPDVTPEDEIVITKIRSVYIEKLMNASVNPTEYHSNPDCMSCVICLIDFNESEQVAELPCDHAFHAACLTDWLVAQLASSPNEVSPTCPTCRMKLSMTEESMQEFMDSVCSPGFLSSHLSRRVHLVFNSFRSGSTTPEII